MNPKKLAVVFIGTGKYFNFFEAWHNSCEKYLFPDIDKVYLVFTDQKPTKVFNNCKFYYQKHEKWPHIALYKYKIISSALKDIEDCSWLIFMDADMEIISNIYLEELFNKNQPYFGVQHPLQYFSIPPFDKFPWTYETNPISKATVTESDFTEIYYQSCLWGAAFPNAKLLVKELEARVDEDAKNGINAIWYDESHLNKFYAERPCEVNILPPIFAYPTGFPPPEELKLEPKILHIEKIDLPSYRG